MRRLFEGGVYSGAALIRVNTVCAVFYSIGGGGGGGQVPLLRGPCLKLLHFTYYYFISRRTYREKRKNPAR